MDESPSPSQRDRRHDLTMLGLFSMFGTGVVMYLIAAGLLIVVITLGVLIATHQVSLPILPPLPSNSPFNG